MLVRELLLRESFWATTNKYRLSNNPKHDSKHGEDYLNVPGVPGGYESIDALEALEAALHATKGEVTNSVLKIASRVKHGPRYRGGEQLIKWLKWVKDNGRKIKASRGTYLSY